MDLATRWLFSALLALAGGLAAAAEPPGRGVPGAGQEQEPCLPAVSTGKADPRLASFDRMVRQFMTKHQVPGLALAVTDHGRLVYARGHGYADVEAREPVRPTSLFRIASLSKPITAVAVLQLVERTDLSLDDQALDVLEGQPYLSGMPVADERQRAITVRHLLQHRGGFDRDRSFDPMFQSVRFAEQWGMPPPAGAKVVIRAMLGQPLDFDPGSRYAYSNYGYCLLGRVIEAVSGEGYEAYVQRHVLAPFGIRDMRIGRTRLEGRCEGEVRYYDPGIGPSVFAEDQGKVVPAPYGTWYLEAMDAHGGWLGSAVDLARFACFLDDPDRWGVLTERSIQVMFARPPGAAGHDEDGRPKAVYYSCGWLNRVVGPGRFNRWHTGSLSGTAALLVRRHDGRNWVVLMNARTSPHASHLGRAIDPVVHQAADAVTEWPEYDLFEEFFPEGLAS